MLTKLLTHTRSSPVARSMAMLTSGSALAQVIGVLASPLLSRIYTPEEFGVLGTVLAISLVISVVGSLKYEMALVLEKDDARAAAVLRLSVLILVIVSVVSAACIVGYSFWSAESGNRSEIQGYLLWLVPLVFLTGLFNIANMHATREEAYRTIAVSAIWRRLCTVACQLILGVLGAQALGLILGNMLGCIAAVALIVARELGAFTRDPGPNRVADVAREHYRFPCYTAPQGLVNMLSDQLPIFMLGPVYGADVVGSYFFTVRILQLPATVMGRPYAGVLQGSIGADR